MRRLTNVLGLSLLLGACDVPGLEVEMDAPEAGPESAPPSEHDLRAAGQDPSELQVLCVLCLLGGNQAVCGVDNETYANKCYATCHQVAVAHTGACSCGDGYLGPGEGCDDGNAANNDACLATCNPASCGDGHVRAGHEACDDGNAVNTDACLASCQPASCGDGFVRAGVESCDDGNASDGCPTTCQPASCGDGIVQAGVEECDDGNTSEDDGCLSTCTTATCGDGHVRVGVEACDDGNTDDGDGCLSTCTTAQCGDGVVHDGVEACDDGNASDADGCLSTCVAASCGDGHVRAGVEVCDDGNASDADGCLPSCVVASCGDGHVQAGVEACDDGNASDADGCLSGCTAAACGDGHVQVGVEGCDDGDLDNDDACVGSCQPAACGDGFLYVGHEGCDDGNQVDHDACRTRCQPSFCGDGVRWFGVEACDDGNPVDSDACRNDCGEAFCGDGVVWGGVEACDDGNADDDDGCLSTCWPASCGDGHVQNGVETCDDGDADDDDACPGNCQTAHCGDGFVQAGVEACDDGNSDPTDGCTDVCAPAVCGDGRVHAGVEQCDDGDLTSGDGCSSACKIEVCGDGIVDAGEDCDGGDACTSACEGQAVLQVAPGHDHTCALLSGGRVKCWGDGALAGLGDDELHGDEPGEMGAALPFVDLGAGLSAVALDAGANHTCALLVDGRVKCWGSNDFGYLGLGDDEARGDGPNEMGDMLPFVDLGADRFATAVAVGDQSTCALLDGGDVKCWGRNQYGQLGLGLASSEHRGDDPNEMGDGLPVVDLGPGRVATSVSVGESHACALLQDGAVKCWGQNDSGQLGLGDAVIRGHAPGEMGDALPPVALAGPIGAVSCGGRFTCARLVDGRVQCWGRNGVGQLGLGDTLYRGDQANEMGPDLPIVDLGTDRLAVSIHAGMQLACARLDDGTAKCWGYNTHGNLGIGSGSHRGNGPGEMGDALPAAQLGAGLSVASLGLSGLSPCAVLQDGAVKCWGANDSGQLGLGDDEDRGDVPGELGDNLPRIKLFSDAW